MRVIHHKYTLFILFMTFLVLIPTNSFGSISSIENQELEKNNATELWSFQQYLEIYVDRSILNHNLQINHCYAIPVNITYFTNLPQHFLAFLPNFLRNKILYNHISKPFQSIQLDIIDIPDWATIRFSDPSLKVPINNNEDGYTAETILYITVDEEAPAQTYSIGIKAFIDSIGRLNSFCTEYVYSCRPEFIPLIDVSTDDQVIDIGSEEKIEVEILISNLANKKARITPILFSSPFDWYPTINPPIMDLNSDESESFNFTVQPPQDFSGFITFKLTFEVHIFPLNPDSPTFSYPLEIIMYRL